jgi:Mg-chelatase subunit ChlD
VFFLKSDLPHGAVAVGTGHTLSLDDLARAGRVEFALPRSLDRVSWSEAFAVNPGRPFSLSGATMRDDYFVFQLASAPRGVRVLEPVRQARLAGGARVRLLGPASRGGREEQHAYGTVVTSTADRIEIDLDLSQRLGGWGGAPVLLSEGGGVVGIVEAAVPGADVTRVLAAPIDGVLEALVAPLDEGRGRSFAAFVSDRSAPGPDEAAPSSDGRRTLIRAAAGEATHLDLEIEYPPDGAEVSSTVCGTFVAGRAQATRGAPRRFDVVLVIDTSRSTVDSAGTDVNGNGEVGESRLGAVGALFGAGLTDPGDSILAAEIAAARQVLLGLDPRSTRVGLVAFAGEAVSSGGRYSRRRPAYTVEGLTADYTLIDRALDDLLATEPEGQTHMAAGIDQATIELKGLRGSYSKTDPESEKVVFFFTDGQPTLPYGPDAEADNVRAVLRAANRAHRGNVRIHSFAIGPEALEGPIAAVEMASRTRGFFTPVRNPGDLVDIVEEVSFADIESVHLEHVGSGREARPFRVTADGSWAGFVELEPGANQIAVTAVADGGAEEKRSLLVSSVEAPERELELPVELVVQRNRLLEDCLLIAKQERLDRERERNEEIRRQLQLEIERERRRARERAAAQRKALDLEAEID